jgi:hypothetical protein
MFYVTPPPSDPREFGRWVYEQFRRLQEQMGGSHDYLNIAATTSAPTAPRAGDIRYVDGTNWNPGAGGPGYYGYNGTTWEWLGGSKRWDDLRFPSTAVTKPGLQDPDFDTNTNSYLFDQLLTEVLLYGAQIPHQWALSTNFHVHVHGFKTVAQTASVAWVLWYKWAPRNGDITAWATRTATTVVSAFTRTVSASIHVIWEFPEITASTQQVSDQLIMHLRREGSLAADNYSHDVALLELDIHYQTDAAGGSIDEYTKP